MGEVATVRVMLFPAAGGLQTYGSAAMIIGDCWVMFAHCPHSKRALRSDESFWCSPWSRWYVP